MTDPTQTQTILDSLAARIVSGTDANEVSFLAQAYTTLLAAHNEVEEGRYRAEARVEERRYRAESRELCLKLKAEAQVKRERNAIACALATSVLAAGGHAGVTEDPAGEAGFRLVVVVMLPTGRVGWHMDEADPSRPWANLPRFFDPWELITGFEQIARVREYLAG